MPVPARQPEPPDIKDITFGRPKRLLGGSPVPDVQDPRYPTTPSRKSGSAPQERFTSDKFGLVGEFNSSPQTQEEVIEMIAPPIPSSKTPSPMKLPREGSVASVVSISPMKIDLALQESVTSLLGKRQGEDDGSRHGKRSRPRRGVSVLIFSQDMQAS